MLVKDESLTSDVRWLRVKDVIDNSFDFQTMSQSVLATNWKKATLGEREKFIDYFSEHLLNTYRNIIQSYTDEQIRYEKETIDGDRAVVDTIVVTKTAEIPVNYKLKNNDGVWYAYDVEIEGSSLVNKYRNEYGAIFNNEGMDGVLAHIKSTFPTEAEVTSSSSE
jgi:phospholipid transport system substrate-binding protein